MSNKVLSENIKVMKVMLPFTPHLANECLELFKCNDSNQWPKVIKNMLEEVKIAIQINGKKTRDVIAIKKDLAQQEIENIILKIQKLKNMLIIRKLLKLSLLNKILNYIL